MPLCVKPACHTSTSFELLLTESTLLCNKEERQRGWTLSDTFEFFEKGIVRTIDIVNGDRGA